MMTSSKQVKYIVGVGASAGGLEAMLSLFSQVKPNGQMSYVVAQHMAKNGHDDLVVKLIGKEATLQVITARDGMAIEPDRIYIIPSGYNGRVIGQRFQLIEPNVSHISIPSVNVLFSSLAESETNRSIGIILSGTGTDGTSGCRDIQNKGGLTIAQAYSQCKFNGMPSSAVDAKAIQHVLTIEQMVILLSNLAVPKVESLNDSSFAMDSKQELETLCKQIFQATGVDYSEYKEDTLLRRIEKRKAVLGLTTAYEYQQHITRDSEELHELQKLFLVSVSSFFRDRDSFECLAAELRKVIATKSPKEVIRIWVAGCANGEEAYTLAILLKEMAVPNSVEITASDLNGEALAVSKEGRYKLSSFKEMDPVFLSRYFTPVGGYYQVNQDIKNCVRFTQCNIMACETPEELDLVSCRNLLIYLKTSLQDQVIRKFHECLRSQGLLFIGQSESLSFIGNSLFAPIDNYHRLFKKRI